ncbi:MAG: dihydroorotase [Bacteroidetes bacterium]|nr:MAG: dihydroorotase [Bacteroidota bacterium]
MKGFLIQNATIVNEGRIFKGNVLVEGDKIVKITSPPSPPLLKERGPGGEVHSIQVIDATGKYLLPGVIDDQVHFREPGLTAKGDLYTESRAAVAGGVTSFMDMPNTNPKTTTLQLLEEKNELAAGKSLANYAFFLGATNDNLEEIRKADSNRVCGVKVFMGASTGNMLVDREETLQGIFAESPLLIAVHSEDEQIIQANIRSYRERYGEEVPVEAHPLIRSAEACYRSSERAVRLAGKYGSRLHILHLSTALEVPLLDRGMPLSEKKVTGEVCVHHLWFNDRDYPRLGARIKWNPAIKSKEDQEALLAGLLDGSIDLVATDHAPHLPEEKARPYFTCPSGGPLIQHSLVAMLELHLQGKIPLESVVQKMSHNVADLYHIEKRGYIREGCQADLVLVDLHIPWEVTRENILYKCGWSPFEGTTFQSSVLSTWVNGHLAYHQGIIDESRKGERLLFHYD